jgi:hypothetical protein
MSIDDTNHGGKDTPKPTIAAAQQALCGTGAASATNLQLLVPGMGQIAVRDFGRVVANLPLGAADKLSQLFNAALATKNDVIVGQAVAQQDIFANAVYAAVKNLKGDALNGLLTTASRHEGIRQTALAALDHAFNETAPSDFPAVLKIAAGHPDAHDAATPHLSRVLLVASMNKIHAIAPLLTAANATPEWRQTAAKEIGDMMYKLRHGNRLDRHSTPQARHAAAAAISAVAAQIPEYATALHAYTARRAQFEDRAGSSTLG